METTTTTPLPVDEEPVETGPYDAFGSIGPFFAVMSVISFLTVASCLFSCFCIRRKIPYSIEWYHRLRWLKWRWGGSDDVDVRNSGRTVGGEAGDQKNHDQLEFQESPAVDV